MEQLVHSSWILHVSCSKRRVAPIAALLSSVVHYSVFGDERMHGPIDNAEGPLKWVSDTSVTIISSKMFMSHSLTMIGCFPQQCATLKTNLGCNYFQ